MVAIQLNLCHKKYEQIKKLHFVRSKNVRRIHFVQPTKLLNSQEQRPLKLTEMNCNKTSRINPTILTLELSKKV